MKEEIPADGDLNILEVPGHSSKFTEALYLYQQQHYLCDVLVITANGFIPAHRLVLVASSPHFYQEEANRNYFYSTDTNFKAEFDTEDMKAIMRLMYTGKLLVTPQNIHRRMQICEYLQLKEAFLLCEEYLSQIVNKESKSKNVGKDGGRDITSEDGDSKEGLKYLNSKEGDSANLVSGDREHIVDVALESQVDGSSGVNTDDTCADQAKMFQSTVCHSVEDASKIQSPRKKDYSYVLLDEIQDGEHSQTSNSSCSTTQEEVSNIDASTKSTLLENTDGTEMKETIEEEDMDLHVEKKMTEEVDQSFVKSQHEKEKEKEAQYWASSQGTESNSANNFVYPSDDAFQNPTIKKFTCRACKVEFLSPQDLVQHRREVHPSNSKKEKFTCDICFKKPNSAKALIEHKNKKHGIPYDIEKFPLIKCEYKDCKFTTIVQQTLRDHVKKVHEQVLPYCICEICGKSCSSNSMMKYHMSTHNSNREQHVCNICGKTSATKYNLKKHIEEVHQKKAKRHLCHFCPYSTLGSKEFDNHLFKVHNVPPPDDRKIYKCDKCDYFTLTKSYLARHETLHQGAERKFTCSTCGKGFYSEANLKAHERRHKAETLKCEVEGCNFSTLYKHIMKNHMSGMHTNSSYRPYRCHLCNHSCKLKGNLNKHLSGKHGLNVMTQVKQRKIALETGTGFQEILKTCAKARSLPFLKDTVELTLNS